MPTVARPSLNDPAFARVAAEKLAPQVKAWLGNEAPDSDETLVDDLIEAVGRAIYKNGYEIARSMESEFGYTPDAQLVELLDETSSLIRDAWESACIAWVTKQGFAGPPVETPVRSVPHPEYGPGIVVENHKHGSSTVYFEGLGHVRKGAGCHGKILEWEQLEVVTCHVSTVTVTGGGEGSAKKDSAVRRSVRPSVYQRIVAASRRGTSLRLSADEVFELSRDDTIKSRAEKDQMNQRGTPDDDII